MQVKKILFVIVLCLILLMPQAFSERNWICHNAEIPTSDINDIVVEGSSIWLATSTGIACYDQLSGTCRKYPVEYDVVWNFTFTLYSAQSIMIDSHFDVWAGTYGGGLMRLDGEDFIFLDGDNKPSDTDIREIAAGKESTLWMVTNRGVLSYDGRNWRAYDESDGLPEYTTYYDIAVDSSGVVWVATSRGLLRLLDGVWTWHRPFPEDSPENYFTRICVDSDGLVWLGTYQRGMICFDGAEFISFPGGDPPAEGALTMEADPVKGVWLSTVSGLFHYNGVGWESFLPENGLPAGDVQAIAFDSSGEPVIGMSTGLYLFGKGAFTQVDLEFAPPVDIIETVEADNDGSVWISYINSNGVGYYDGFSWRRYTTENGLPSYTAQDIAIAADGTPWFVCDYYIACFRDGRFVSERAFDAALFDEMSTYEQSAFEIAPAPDGKIWYRNNIDHICCLDGESKTYFDMKDVMTYEYSLKAIFVDHNGNVWVGADNTVARYDGSSWQVFKDDVIFPPHEITDIDEDGNGNIWFATSGGAARFDGETWTRFDSIPGAPLTGLLSVVVDHNDTVWFGTAGQGMVFYDGTGWHEHELMFDGYNVRIEDCTVSPDNTIWCATSGGGLWEITPETSSVAEQAVLPRIGLLPAYPNPFNPAVTIPFEIDEKRQIVLDIYDVQGQHATRLADNVFRAGRHELHWNAAGHASGVYFCRLHTGQVMKAAKILYVK